LPFQHIIDAKRGIVLVKGTGKISIADIMAEIQEAERTRRGADISRRLIDMTEQEFMYDPDTAAQILDALQEEAKILHPRRIALLLKEIPRDFDLEKVLSHLNSPTTKIGLFVDRARALEFLNEAVS